MKFCCKTAFLQNIAVYEGMNYNYWAVIIDYERAAELYHLEDIVF